MLGNLLNKIKRYFNRLNLRKRFKVNPYFWVPILVRSILIFFNSLFRHSALHPVDKKIYNSIIYEFKYSIHCYRLYQFVYKPVAIKYIDIITTLSFFIILDICYILALVFNYLFRNSVLYRIDIILQKVLIICFKYLIYYLLELWNSLVLFFLPIYFLNIFQIVLFILFYVYAVMHFKNNCCLLMCLPLVSYLLKFLLEYIGTFAYLFLSCSLLLFCCTSFILILFFDYVSVLDYSSIVHDYFYFGTWISSGVLMVDWAFTFDILSLFMCFVVSTISFFVHLYSIEYMRSDPHLVRFISYLSIFTFFMLILVSSENFLIFFLGWEGIGLSSFLLISFWSTRVQAVKSAIKAILVNRIGDLFFLFAIALIFYVFGSIDFLTVFYLYPFYADISISLFFTVVRLCDLIALLLFLAAVSKSAQFGLHTWLPDAMEGPTPVSALIHAATLVTAGIFLIVRCSVIFEFSESILSVMAVWGSITCIFAAITANYQVDLKKIIAYSTCSQLGYMVVSCGLSEYQLAFFHLINHAFFKAVLFLCAGFFIHASLNDQDIRRISVVFRRSPLVSTCLDLALLCLVSVPFFGGFYSKDLILESSFLLNFSDSFHYFIYYVCLLGTLFTVGYASRISNIILDSELYSSRIIYFNSRSNSGYMVVSILCLTLISIFLSYFLSGLFNSDHYIFWDSIFVKTDKTHFLLQKDYLPFYIQNLPLILLLLVYFLIFFCKHSILSVKINCLLLSIKPVINCLSFAASNRFLIDYFYNSFLEFFSYYSFCLYCQESYSIFFKRLPFLLEEFFFRFNFTTFLNRSSVPNYFCAFLLLIFILYFLIF